MSDMKTLTQDHTLTLILLFVLSSVSAQEDQVKGHVGGRALLLCIYDADDLPEKVSSFWRDQDDAVVLDTIDNVPNFSSSSAKFRGRVSTDHLQRTGNFSIVLDDLTLTDSGTYECHVPQVYFQKNVQLIVTERKLAVEEEISPPTGFNDSAVTLNLPLLTILISFYWFI